eukprot:SAG22_NODE_2268_length_2769_cov_1.823970_4_plen_159_part_00
MLQEATRLMGGPAGRPSVLLEWTGAIFRVVTDFNSTKVKKIREFFQLTGDEDTPTVLQRANATEADGGLNLPSTGIFPDQVERVLERVLDCAQKLTKIKQVLRIVPEIVDPTFLQQAWATLMIEAPAGSVPELINKIFDSVTEWSPQLNGSGSPIVLP